MLRQAAFQVGCLVAVNVAAFGQFVDHADDLGQEGLGLGLVFQIAQVLDGRTRRFFVVTVLQTTFFVLADALQG